MYVIRCQLDMNWYMDYIILLQLLQYCISVKKIYLIFSKLPQASLLDRIYKIYRDFQCKLDGHAKQLAVKSVVAATFI